MTERWRCAIVPPGSGFRCDVGGASAPPRGRRQKSRPASQNPEPLSHGRGCRPNRRNRVSRPIRSTRPIAGRAGTAGRPGAARPARSAPTRPIYQTRRIGGGTGSAGCAGAAGPRRSRRSARSGAAFGARLGARLTTGRRACLTFSGVGPGRWAARCRRFRSARCGDWHGPAIPRLRRLGRRVVPRDRPGRSVPRLAWTGCRHRAPETPGRRGARQPATDRLGAAPATRRGPAAGLAAPAGRPAVPDLTALRRRERLARESRSPAGAAVQDVPGRGPGRPIRRARAVNGAAARSRRAPGRVSRWRSAKCRPTGPCSPKARRGITDQLPAHTPTGPTRAPTKKSDDRQRVPAERRPADVVGLHRPADPGRTPRPLRHPVPAARRVPAPAAVVMHRPAPRMLIDPGPAVARVPPRAVGVRPPAGADAGEPHRAVDRQRVPLPVVLERRRVGGQLDRQRLRPRRVLHVADAAGGPVGERRRAAQPTRAQRGSRPRGSIATSSSAAIGTSAVAWSASARARSSAAIIDGAVEIAGGDLVLAARFEPHDARPASSTSRAVVDAAAVRTMTRPRTRRSRTPSSTRRSVSRSTWTSEPSAKTSSARPSAVSRRSPSSSTSGACAASTPSARAMSTRPSA